jgi:hypothetical protein
MDQQKNATALTGMDKKPGWVFYVAWIFFTSLCIPAAYFVCLLFLRVVITFLGDYIYVNGVRHITEDYLALYFLVPVMGLLTGVVQYGMLRRFLPRMGWWVLATLGGWILGMFLIALLIRLDWMTPSNLDLTLLLLGLSIGFGQWLILMHRLPGAGWWVAANLLGWGLLSLIFEGNFIDQYGLFTLGFCPACTTAATLALLMRRAPGGVISSG